MTSYRTSAPPADGSVATVVPHRFCAHPPSAWSVVDGMRTCGACGTRRADDYGALALALELPERVGTFDPPYHRRGSMTNSSGASPSYGTPGAPSPSGSASTRRAELLRRVREANRWSVRDLP
ncbi:DUF6255 family natural product biosynthesis protein [Streptomyces sp. URMC 126]|uniref:DUF6255 family natural product biosynthesis protein n=1 Tax=Streptomyces sp. URMC 126 TaxID=3423401 RepID=UPI003F1AD3EA